MYARGARKKRGCTVGDIFTIQSKKQMCARLFLNTFDKNVSF